MGNGAKAAQKRERNADKTAKGTTTSQNKVNEAAKSIICRVCKQPFLITTRSPALIEHADKRHSKTIEECFPGVPK